MELRNSVRNCSHAADPVGSSIRVISLNKDNTKAHSFQQSMINRSISFTQSCYWADNLNFLKEQIHLNFLKEQVPLKFPHLELALLSLFFSFSPKRSWGLLACPMQYLALDHLKNNNNNNNQWAVKWMFLFWTFILCLRSNTWNH